MSRSQRSNQSNDGGATARAHAFVDWLALNLKGALAPLAGVFTVLSTVLGIIASSTWPSQGEPGNHTVWLIIGVIISAGVAILATAFIDVLRRDQERGKIAVKVAAQEELREAVIPSLRSLTRLTVLPRSQRATQFAKMASQVLLARPVIFPNQDGIRMVIYRIEKDQKGNKRLEPVDFAGRALNIPAAFDASSAGRGKKVFEWLADNPKTKFVADTTVEEDSAWAGTGNGYQTYISTPIVAAGVPLGMLTVDAPFPDDLDETNIPIVEVLAHLLATAFVVGPD